MSKRRLAKLTAALASGDTFDALTTVREMIPDDGEGAQETVVYVYGCILEVNSAGVSILFDRFDDDELRTIDSALAAIGAARTLAAVRELQALFDTSLAEGKDRLDAAEWLVEQPGARRSDREAPGYVEEMQEKLLEFCKANVKELAAR